MTTFVLSQILFRNPEEHGATCAIPREECLGETETIVNGTEMTPKQSATNLLKKRKEEKKETEPTRNANVQLTNATKSAHTKYPNANT